MLELRAAFSANLFANNLQRANPSELRHEGTIAGPCDIRLNGRLALDTDLEVRHVTGWLSPR